MLSIKIYKYRKWLFVGGCAGCFLMGWWLWDVVAEKSPPPPMPVSRPVKPAPEPYFYFEDEASRSA